MQAPWVRRSGVTQRVRLGYVRAVFLVAASRCPRTLTTVRSVLMFAVIAGCGFQIPGGSSTGDGAVGDGGAGDAPGDGMPTDMAIDMAIDGTQPPTDSDGDGIIDAQDNCPAIANANQRNHDGDAFGDACDRCPHLPSTTDPDGDSDGVGDACDPRPATGGDLRVLWAGFYDAAEIQGWGGQGTFTVTGGYLEQTSASVTGFAPPGTVKVPFVMAELVVDQMINTNENIGLAVTTMSQQFECTITKTGSNVDVRARQLGGSSQSTSWTGTFAAGSRIQLSLDLKSDVDCRARQGNTSIQQVATTAANPAGRTYVGTEGIAARFDYLFVVDEAP